MKNTARKYLALDLGATKFACMSSKDGARCIVQILKIPILNSAMHEFRQIADFLTAVVGEIKGDPVLSAAPSLSCRGQVVCWPNRPYWIGFPLVKKIERVLGRRIRHMGDGEAAALADAGAEHNEIYLSLYFGTGIGGGIVTNAKVLRLGDVSSELGHIIVDPTGPPCNCGKTGCMQAIWKSYASGRVPYAKLVENLARLTVNLSQIFPGCTVTLGGRLQEVPESVIGDLQVEIERIAPRNAWFPHIRESSHGVNAPLVGALREAVREGRMPAN